MIFFHCSSQKLCIVLAELVDLLVCRVVCEALCGEKCVPAQSRLVSEARPSRAAACQ